MSVLSRQGLAIALLSVSAGPALGQGVLVAPQAVIVDDRTDTGSFTIINPGEDRVEIAISAVFGFPVTDSSGTFYLRTMLQPDDTMPSAAGWVEAFPSRMFLEPGSRRLVRVLVTPPEGLPDGEHWARLIIASRETKPSVTSTAGDGISVALKLEVRSVIPFLYRHGDSRTAVRLGEPVSKIEGDSLAVRVPLNREGNSAWIGTLKVELVDPKGDVVRQASMPLGLYYDAEPRLAMSRQGLKRGSYSLRVEARGHREDIPMRLVLPTATVSKTATVPLP